VSGTNALERIALSSANCPSITWVNANWIGVSLEWPPFVLPWGFLNLRVCRVGRDNRLIASNIFIPKFKLGYYLFTVWELRIPAYAETILPPVASVVSLCKDQSQRVYHSQSTQSNPGPMSKDIMIVLGRSSSVDCEGILTPTRDHQRVRDKRA